MNVCLSTSELDFRQVLNMPADFFKAQFELFL